MRINSAGTSLSQSDFILTLLSVNWDQGRKDLESFCEKASTTPENKESSPFNTLINPEVGQMLRPIIMLGFRRAKFEAAYNLLVGKDIDTDKSADVENLEKFKSAQNTTLNLNNWHEYINCVFEAGYLSTDMLTSKNVFAFCYGFFLIGKELGVEKRELMCEMFNNTDIQQQLDIKKSLDEKNLLNPGKVYPILRKCAEEGRVHVHRNEEKFPDLPRF